MEMSLAGIIPPQKQEVKIVGAKAEVTHSVAEVVARGFPDNMTAKEREKLIAELGENAGPFSVGGYGHWVQKDVDPRTLWTPKERKQWQDFTRMWRKYKAERIPVLQEELRMKLLNRFGTIHPDMMEKNLNVQMVKDPRLLIKVRRGIVKTSVKAQHERATRSLEGEKR